MSNRHDSDMDNMDYPERVQYMDDMSYEDMVDYIRA